MEAAQSAAQPTGDRIIAKLLRIAERASRPDRAIDTTVASDPFGELIMRSPLDTLTRINGVIRHHPLHKRQGLDGRTVQVHPIVFYLV